MANACLLLLVFFISNVIVLNYAAVTRTYPAVAGSTLVITCPLDIGLTYTNIVWDRTGENGATISVNGKVESWADPGKFSASTNGVGKQVLQIEDVWTGDEGVYRCYQWPTTADTVYHETAVVVLVNPKSLTLVGPNQKVTRDEGETLKYECSVDNSKPLPDFSWRLKDSNGQNTDLSNYQTYVDSTTTGGVGSRTSVLSIAATREMYRGTITCTAESDVLIYSDSKSVDIPDLNLIPSQPTITLPSTIQEGQTYTLTCKSRGAKPVSTLSWVRNGIALDSTYTTLKEFDDTFTATSTVSIDVTRDDHMTEFRCDTSNEVMLRQFRPSLFDTVSLDVQYRPVLTIPTHVIEVTEGDDVTLNCSVNANPQPYNTTWLRGNSYVTTEDEHYDVSYSSNLTNLHISSVNRSDIGLYHCQAKNIIGVANSKDVALHVQHRPQCHDDHQYKYGAKLKSPVKLTCRMYANPNELTFYWTSSSGDRVSIPGQTDANDRYHAFSTMTFTPNNTYDYTSFECSANNSLGFIYQPCLIEVVPPGPSQAPADCTFGNITSSSMAIRCKPGFDGGSKQYFSLQQRAYGKQSQTTVVILTSEQTAAEFQLNKLDESTEYVFRVCSSNTDFSDQTACTADLRITTETYTVVPLAAPGIGAAQESPASTNAISNEAIYVIVGLCVVGCVGGLIGTLVFIIKKKKTSNAVDVVE